MTDPRVKKLADIIVNYSLGVKPGEWVTVTANIIAEPLVREIYTQILKAGGNPTHRFDSDAMTETFFKEAPGLTKRWKRCENPARISLNVTYRYF